MSERTKHCDQTAMLVSHAAAWRTGNAETKGAPPSPNDSLAERDLTTVERATALRSARYAAGAFPGPVGDLIKSTIEEYVSEGTLLDPFDLARRLLRSMQTMEAQDPLPPRGGHDHLPAVYVPGSGMRWRHRTTADEDRG